MKKYTQSDEVYHLMRAFRKKPVIIHAVQMLEPFEVETMEGVMRGSPGDWLMRGVKGELYVCDAEIFSLTYEEAHG